MMRIIFFLMIFLSIFTVHAEETTISLEKVHINLHDKKSIERGAKFFATTCMACHTLIYLRYDPVAQQAGITYEKMPIQVKTWPFNVTPPDLSLEANVRGVDWIYTYLHSFYVDPTRPTGFNNLLVPNTAMAGIVAAFQGQQVLAKDIKQSAAIMGRELQWYDELELQKTGSMTTQAFDETITDVVNFLAYAAEPYAVKQARIGCWVMGFLVLLLILAYLLKKEYWKAIYKKHKK